MKLLLFLEVMEPLKRLFRQGTGKLPNTVAKEGGVNLQLPENQEHVIEQGAGIFWPR